MNFGEKLKLLRTNSGFSQLQLANILNDQYKMKVSKGRVSNWENGNNYPALITAQCIAEIFNIDMNYFKKNAGPLSEYELNNETNGQIINSFNKLSPKRRKNVIKYIESQLNEQNK